MPIFIIALERRDRAGNHDYQPLLSELEAHKCFPLWDSAWLGSFANNAAQVHNYFKRLLGEADRIVVCEMTNHFCYSGVVQGANRWLELNPPAGGLDSARIPEPVASVRRPTGKPAKAPAKKASSRAPATKAATKLAAANAPAAGKPSSKKKQAKAAPPKGANKAASAGKRSAKKAGK